MSIRSRSSIRWLAYHDGSILAQLGPSDMRVAIGYALQHPVRGHLPVERLDFAKLARLDFETPDDTRFPALRLARLAMQHGGLSGAVMNGAKEAALEAFIAGQIPFLGDGGDCRNGDAENGRGLRRQTSTQCLRCRYRSAAARRGLVAFPPG